MFLVLGPMRKENRTALKLITAFSGRFSSNALLTVYQNEEGRVLGSRPRYCICTNASRGLSATAEFLVHSLKFIRNLS